MKPVSAGTPDVLLEQLERMPDTLNPAQVGRLFGVDPKTVARWCKQGRMPYFRTIGGHRRFAKGDIARIIRTR